MFSNFQLAAVSESHKVAMLLGVEIDGRSQATLAHTWHQQWLELTQDCTYVPFDLGYNPEPDERFVLPDYVPPDWLLKGTEGRLRDADSLALTAESLASLRAIVGFGKLDGDEWIVLQNFTRSHVMQPGSFLFLQQGTLALSERPALSLGGKLAAAFNTRTRQLVFENFKNTNAILPLTNFIAEASDQEIREVLSHPRIKAENKNAIVASAKQWMRKRFAMLKQSGVLDTFTAVELQKCSDGYGVDLDIDGEQIVFPQDPRHARKVLQFLNEERFRGAITAQIYETNSKRTADV